MTNRPPFALTEAIRVLFRTPAVFYAWLGDLTEQRVHETEGPDTWSTFDVVGHLIEGEKHDWIPRLEIILSGSGEPFEPFDRFAMLETNRGRTMQELLDEFRTLRLANVQKLKELSLGENDLDREGRHPDLGTVTARQLIATWVAHDHSHLAQTGRILARTHAEDVGPWRAYLSLLSGE